MRAFHLVTLAALTAVTPPAGAQLLAPSVFASIEDHSPFSGTGESFKPAPFEGIVIRTSTLEARAIREFDLASLAGASVQAATLSGTVTVNNGLDTGLRTFDFVLYPADGLEALSDYQAPGVVIGSGSYAPPADVSFAFAFDVTSELQGMLDDGAVALGLRVQATSSPNASNAVSGVLLDVQATGGPTPTSWTNHTGLGQIGSPAVADLDGDGRDEVVLATVGGSGGLPGRLEAWRHDGTDLPGFPVDLTSGSVRTPALADLDGDGDLEILVATNTGLRVHEHSGAPVAGWPTTGSMAEVAVGDIDGDGRPEVVVSRVGSSALAYEDDGSFKASFTLTTWPFFSWESGPALGDLDGDGDLEVIGRGTDRVCAWHGDGTVVPGFPVDVAGETTGRPVVADLDGDGDLEIVITSDVIAPLAAGIDQLVVLSAGGALEAGWPRTAEMQIHDQPSVEDLDGDGDLEIVLLGGDTFGAPRLTVLHHDGSPLQGFPLTPQLPVPASGRSAVTFADLDGDWQPEAIAQIGNAIVAYDSDGSEVPGYPKVLPASILTSTSSPAPAAADLDKDGYLELVQVASTDVTRVDSLAVFSSDDLASWTQDDGSAGGASRYRGASLSALPHALSASAGNGVQFAIELGVAEAGRPYVLLPSLGGTAPGLPLPSGPGTLPLNVDALTLAFLGVAPSPMFPGFLGLLDGSGSASASLTPPAGSLVGLLGERLDLAAVVGPPFTRATNAVGILLAP